MFQVEWKELTKLKISDTSRRIINSAWAASTSKQYSHFLRRFRDFCSLRGKGSYKQSDLSTAIDFLSFLFD